MTALGHVIILDTTGQQLGGAEVRKRLWVSSCFLCPDPGDAFIDHAGRDELPERQPASVVLATLVEHLRQRHAVDLTGGIA